MDRLEEFSEIIEKIKNEKQENTAEEPILRNRNLSRKPENPEEMEATSEIFNFSKSFLSECSLLVITASK